MIIRTKFSISSNWLDVALSKSSLQKNESKVYNLAKLVLSLLSELHYKIWNSFVCSWLRHRSLLCFYYDIL